MEDAAAATAAEPEAAPQKKPAAFDYSRINARRPALTPQQALAVNHVMRRACASDPYDRDPPAPLRPRKAIQLPRPVPDKPSKALVGYVPQQTKWEVHEAARKKEVTEAKSRKPPTPSPPPQSPDSAPSSNDEDEEEGDREDEDEEEGLSPLLKLEISTRSLPKQSTKRCYVLRQSRYRRATSSIRTRAPRRRQSAYPRRCRLGSPQRMPQLVLLRRDRARARRYPRTPVGRPPRRRRHASPRRLASPHPLPPPLPPPLLPLPRPCLPRPPALRRPRALLPGRAPPFVRRHPLLRRTRPCGPTLPSLRSAPPRANERPSRRLWSRPQRMATTARAPLPASAHHRRRGSPSCPTTPTPSPSKCRCRPRRPQHPGSPCPARGPSPCSRRPCTPSRTTRRWSRGHGRYTRRSSSG